MKVYSIGRNADCSIVLDDPQISRRHALLKVYPTGKMELIDSGSNGTFVNGIKLASNVPFPVTRKDVISFAHVKQLDWKQVEDPLKIVKWIAGGILSFAIIIGACVGVSSIVNSCSHPSSGYETIEETTTENKSNGKNVDKQKPQEVVNEQNQQQENGNAIDLNSHSTTSDKTPSQQKEEEVKPNKSKFFPPEPRPENKQPQQQGQKQDVKKQPEKTSGPVKQPEKTSEPVKQPVKQENKNTMIL